MNKIDKEINIDFLKEKIYEKKGIDIKILDVRQKSILCDYFIITTGLNTIHTKAIADNILNNLPKNYNYSIEGLKDANWILIDLAEIIIHIFTPEARDYYDLESIYTGGYNYDK